MIIKSSLGLETWISWQSSLTFSLFKDRKVVWLLQRTFKRFSEHQPFELLVFLRSRCSPDIDFYPSFKVWDVIGTWSCNVQPVKISTFYHYLQPQLSLSELWKTCNDGYRNSHTHPGTYTATYSGVFQQVPTVCSGRYCVLPPPCYYISVFQKRLKHSYELIHKSQKKKKNIIRRGNK